MGNSVRITIRLLQKEAELLRSIAINERATLNSLLYQVIKESAFLRDKGFKTGSEEDHLTKNQKLHWNIFWENKYLIWEDSISISDFKQHIQFYRVMDSLRSMWHE